MCVNVHISTLMPTVNFRANYQKNPKPNKPKTKVPERENLEEFLLISTLGSREQSFVTW